MGIYYFVYFAGIGVNLADTNNPMAQIILPKIPTQPTTSTINLKSKFTEDSDDRDSKKFRNCKIIGF